MPSIQKHDFGERFCGSGSFSYFYFRLERKERLEKRRISEVFWLSDHSDLSNLEGHVTALAIITTPFDAWLAQGRDLLTQRNALEWELADWLSTGREQFVDQAGFDFLADHLGIAPKRLKIAASIAKSFPPALRDQTLTFDHYEAVSNLPTLEALSVLQDARARHLDERETRVEAVKRKALSSPEQLPRDDPEYDELMGIVRAWNRADRNARQQFADLMSECHLGVIEA